MKGFRLVLRDKFSNKYILFLTILARRVRRNAANSKYDLSLVNGTTSSEGTVIVKRKSDGATGAICGNGWTLSDAIVVCRQLGYFAAITNLSKSILL